MRKKDYKIIATATSLKNIDNLMKHVPGTPLIES